jgi:hypothetical protein
LFALLILALAFDLLNGFHDSSNFVPAFITSRAMYPRTTLSLTLAAELFGTFRFSVGVSLNSERKVARKHDHRRNFVRRLAAHSHPWQRDLQDSSDLWDRFKALRRGCDLQLCHGWMLGDHNAGYKFKHYLRAPRRSSECSSIAGACLFADRLDTDYSSEEIDLSSGAFSA